MEALQCSREPRGIYHERILRDSDAQMSEEAKKQQLQGWSSSFIQKFKQRGHQCRRGDGEDMRAESDPRNKKKI